jgi:ABC-2 type transport system permease protein
VNWQHLRVFVWLRWRLLVNQWRRAGAFNAVLMMLVTVGLLVMVIPLFIGCFLLGLYVIPKAAPVHLMYAWDGLIVAFLFFWGIGLITELQRTEPLSLSKFLHLPVSANGAFLINYLSSLFRLSLILFAPVMLGFCLALIFVKGWLLLPVLPALVAFLLMVTALTYQLQGWLAALMSNPRRRRTVIVVTTATLVLIVQLPNLLNYFALGGAVRQQLDRSKTLAEEMETLNRTARSQGLDDRELTRRQQEVLKKFEAAKQEADRVSAERWERTTRLANGILPFGWLPMGVVSAAEGRVLPSILGVMGMTLIGTASLWRAYRTTVGIYQGQPTNRKDRPVAAIASPSSARKPGALLLEARLPGVSEPVSAIALGGLRSLMRSPEAKMMLLTPLIMVPIFGSAVFRGRHDMPELIRPLVAIGGMGVVLLGVMQLMTNQFGFDRDGFRVFVLCSASRRDILLGKNLAFAPVALGLAAILLAAVQVLCPMRLDHFLAMFPQYVSMYLLFCIITNLVSIYAPVYVAAGSLKPSNPKMTTVLLQLVMVSFLLPLTEGPTLLPLGIEAGLRSLGWPAAAPIYLVLSLVECAVVVLIYGLSLELLGSLFQAREQRILEAVTNRAP